ncbi:MAG: hypothetical protein ACQETL_10825 [Bacteroidota bacterium]
MMKLIFKSVLILSVIFGSILNLSAQQFLTPVNSLTGDAKVVTKDGEVIKGDIRSAFFSGKGLKSFRIKDAETGEKTRFKADEVESLRIKMDAWAKFATKMEQTSSVQKMSEANFEEAVDREYIYYHSVKWPKKRKKYILSQLLNAGFDSKIKVYDYPAGKKTASVGIGGMDIAGGNAKEYVVKLGDQEETIMALKRKYDKEYFDMFFGDCEKLSSLDKNEKEWDEFAAHVFIYDTECE